MLKYPKAWICFVILLGILYLRSVPLSAIHMVRQRHSVARHVEAEHVADAKENTNDARLTAEENILMEGKGVDVSVRGCHELDFVLSHDKSRTRHFCINDAHRSEDISQNRSCIFENVCIDTQQPGHIIYFTDGSDSWSFSTNNRSDERAPDAQFLRFGIYKWYEFANISVYRFERPNECADVPGVGVAFYSMPNGLRNFGHFIIDWSVAFVSLMRSFQLCLEPIDRIIFTGHWLVRYPRSFLEAMVKSLAHDALQIEELPSLFEDGATRQASAAASSSADNRKRDSDADAVSVAHVAERCRKREIVCVPRLIAGITAFSILDSTRIKYDTKTTVYSMCEHWHYAGCLALGGPPHADRFPHGVPRCKSERAGLVQLPPRRKHFIVFIHKSSQWSLRHSRMINNRQAVHEKLECTFVTRKCELPPQLAALRDVDVELMETELDGGVVPFSEHIRLMQRATVMVSAPGGASFAGVLMRPHSAMLFLDVWDWRRNASIRYLGEENMWNFAYVNTFFYPLDGDEAVRVGDTDDRHSKDENDYELQLDKIVDYVGRAVLSLGDSPFINDDAELSECE